MTTATGPSTAAVSVTPIDAAPCDGITRKGDRQPLDLCRTCLCHSMRSLPGPRITPGNVEQEDGTFWCQLRVEA